MRGKILVVVENADIRNMAESLLKEQGYDVFSFDTTQKGLDLLLISRPDLIVLDDSLPEPPIVKVCQKVRQDQKLANVPIIVILNTLEAVKEAETLKKAGASDFLVQPLNAKELLEKVEIYLLERAASTGEGLPSAPSPKPAASAPLDTIFSSEGSLDIDSILSEGSTTTQPSHLEDMQKPAEDEKLEIQTGSPWLEFTPETGQKSEQEAQHDYSWFLDEMGKEGSGKWSPVPDKSQSEPTSPAPKKESSSQPAGRKDKIQVEELGTSKLDYQKLAAQSLPKETVKAEFNPQVVLEDEDLAKPKEPAPSKQETTKLMPSASGAEYQKLYSDLTEKIAARLAKELADRLKPETIMQLLKEELEKNKK